MHTGSFVYRWITSFIVFTPSAKSYWKYKKNALNKVKDSFQERQKEKPNPGNKLFT